MTWDNKSNPTPAGSGSGSSSTSGSATCGGQPCISGGKVEYSDDKVEVKTGATYDPSNTDGISIKVKCAKNPHVIQFIYREIIGADGKPVPDVEFSSAAGTYKSTTDPNNPNWNTDSAAKPNPNYESGGASNSDAGSLTTFDQPSLVPDPGQTERATFKAYTVCDGKVIKEITWVRSQKHGESPKYSVSVKNASALPDWAKKQHKDQGYNSAP